MSTDFDVAIIGSGAGGGMAAKLLAECSDRSIVVLEKGQDFYVYKDSAGDVCGGCHRGDQSLPVSMDIHSTFFSNDELKSVSRYLTAQDPLIEPRTFRLTEAEETTQSRVSPTDVTVGGSTITYGAIARRVHPDDFAMLSNYGAVEDANLADWPITYDVLAPFYTAAELIMGVQGDARDNPFEAPHDPTAFYRLLPDEGYPMPPGDKKYGQEKLRKAAARLGYHPFPAPAAINSREYGGRPACTNCGFCLFFGCPINAKGSVAVTALLDARRAGCEVKPGCFVYNLQSNGDGTVNVSYQYGEDKRSTLTAKKVILACGAIESARLCLLSNIGNGPVGQNLMFHTESVAAGFFPEPLHNHRGRNIAVAIDDFVGPVITETVPQWRGQIVGGGVVEFGGHLFPIQEASYLPTWGKPHDLYMRQRIARAHQLGITLIGEALPRLENKVDLDPSVKDYYGQPVARITYQPHSNDGRLIELIMPKLEALLSDAGALATFSISGLGGLASAYHQLGTLRMGTDPNTSVTNPQGKFHGYDNLYCVDASLFPTSTSYDPVLTIFALGLYVSACLMVEESGGEPRDLLSKLTYPS